MGEIIFNLYGVRRNQEAEKCWVEMLDRAEWVVIGDYLMDRVSEGIAHNLTIRSNRLEKLFEERIRLKSFLPSSRIQKEPGICLFECEQRLRDYELGDAMAYRILEAKELDRVAMELQSKRHRALKLRKFVDKLKKDENERVHLNDLTYALWDYEGFR
jgi:hypothetical protein